MVVKTGVALPDDLYERLVAIARSMGYTSISRAIRDAVELFIAFNRWWSSQAPLAGTLQAVVEERRLGDAVREAAASPAAKTVIARTLGHGHALLLVVVDGEVEEVKRLYKKLSSTRGVAAVQASLIAKPPGERRPSEPATHGHHQAGGL